MPETTLSRTLYPTPFSLAYWKSAARELKSFRVIILAALFVALRIVIASLSIPVPFGDRRIFFTFFVNALGSMIYGPIVSLFAGFSSDIIGFVIHPTGVFFPGYTLTSMASSFIYALFLYRARLSVLRIVLCKTTVTLLTSIGLNSLWSTILYKKGFYFYLVGGITKNLLLLPFEIILLVMFLQLMVPVMERMKVIPRQPKKIIALI